MRLVLFADLHLDTPFAWAPAPVARRRRHALRQTLERIVALCAEVGADALCAAGDLYEHDRFAPDTGAFLRQAFARAGLPVLLAPGNHDWYGPESLYARVGWPANVHVFTGTDLEAYELSDGLTVWGAAHRAAAGTEGFLDRWLAAGDRVARGGVNLALFHGSERRGLDWQGGGKQPHAPFDEAQIPQAGFDHALCGHYHRPQAGDALTYPGNPEPLTFGEDGERGAVVVDVHPDGSLTRTWRRVAVTDCHDLLLDCTGAETVEEIQRRARALLTGRAGLARLTVAGELDPAVDLRPEEDLSAAALELDDALDALLVRTGRLEVGYDLEVIAAEATVRGQFVRDVQADERLDADQRRRVLLTGLRALDGRDDLEVA